MSTKIIDRVAKLLKLAESDNVHEAANAAGKAQQLMAEHQITAEMVEGIGDDEPSGTDRGPMGQWDVDEHTGTSAWRWSLAWEVSRPNGCRPWRKWLPSEITRRRDGSFKRTRRVVTTFIGREADAQTAAYLYRYLVAEIDRLAKQQRGRGRSYISAFRHGAVDEIGYRLAAAKREAEEQLREQAQARDDASRAMGGESTALVRTNDAIARLKIAGNQAGAWMDEHDLKYSRTSSHTIGSGKGYHDGARAGSQIQLSHGGRALGAQKGRLKG